MNSPFCIGIPEQNDQKNDSTFSSGKNWSLFYKKMNFYEKNI